MKLDLRSIHSHFLFLFACVGLFAGGTGGTGFAQEKPKAPRLSDKEAKQRFRIASPEDSKSDSEKSPAVQPAGYRTLLEKVTPAVVSVFPERLITAGDDDDPILRFFGGDQEEGNEIMGVGSGVIVAPDGWIVTNSHVVHLATGKLADSVTVEISDRRRFTAAIVGDDPLTDLALLKIDADELETLAIGDSDEVKTGDLVFAVGNPFKLGMTATMGMVSATRRTRLNLTGTGGYESFIQTDAAINPGNSGGALVNARGRLIGINTAIYGHGGNIGIGFAIPTRLMARVLSGLARDGEMRRGFFGLQTGEVDQERAESAGSPRIAGAWVADLMKGGPAEDAGLEIDDVITAANGRTVENRGDLRIELSCVRPDETIELTVFRNGKKKQLTLTAGKSPSVEKPTENLFTLDAVPGVRFRASGSGIEVAEIEKEKVGNWDQLSKGMVISSINGKPITSAEDAAAALRKGVNKVVTNIGKGTRTLAIRLD